MLRRVVIGAALACLMGGAAYAVDEPAEGDDQCTQQLAAAEEAVESKQEAKPMSDEDFAKVNELLDQADAQCTEGNSQGRDSDARHRQQHDLEGKIEFGTDRRRGRPAALCLSGGLCEPFLDLSYDQSLNPAHTRAGG